jgi:hypothetical protein
MKPSTKRGTMRELEPDVAKEVRRLLGSKNGFALHAKGRSKHPKLELPNGVLMPLPNHIKTLRASLRRHGVV